MSEYTEEVGFLYFKFDAELVETNSFKVEDLDESEGFTDGDTIKIMGTKYVVRMGNDDGMSLEKEDEK